MTDPLPDLAAAASMLEWPLPPERDEAVCQEAARLVDTLLARVARGRGALDVAIGEGLDALGVGDRALRLGYAGVGDYARERLGIPASTAVKMARLARELRERPILRASVLDGEITARCAETILAVALGEEEAVWVERARSQTIRALKKAMQERGAREAPDEPWDRIDLRLSGDQRATVDEAMDMAGRLLGATAPRWQRIEAIAGEYLGAHGTAGADVQVPERAQDTQDALEEWLERESTEWAFLDRMLPVPVPESTRAQDPHELDAGLRRLAALRDRWDHVFGHLALVFRTIQAWRRLGFASFDHYCVERLGMAGRTVAQRAQLERKMHDVPALAAAVRERTLSYEKARLLARHLDDDAVGGWIDRAAAMTCIGLRRALEHLDEAQMCARGDFAFRGPHRVCALFLMACGAARAGARKWMGPGECLAHMAGHFVETWGPALRGRTTLQKEVLERDRGLCQVPGCSRAAAHAHHIVYRSMGGPDEASNLVSLCAAHHLHGVHRGYVGVSGEAPHELRWRLGA